MNAMHVKKIQTQDRFTESLHILLHSHTHSFPLEQQRMAEVDMFSFWHRDKFGRNRLLKQLHRDTIALIFREVNSSSGGGENEIPLPFKNVYRYWCTYERFPDHFDPANPDLGAPYKRLGFWC